MSRVRARLIAALALLVVTGSIWLPESSAQEPPVILAHYMPWYQSRPHRGFWGWHWTMGGAFRPDETDYQGYPHIASHYHPLIGPYDSSDRAVLEYHALLMHVAGIDGVIVDWYGESQLHDYPLINQSTRDLFKATERIGLSFAICYEDRTLKALVDAGQFSAADVAIQAKADMAFVRDEWTNSVNYVTFADQPVLFNFGPVYLKSHLAWQEALTAFPQPPALVTLDNLVYQTSWGAYPWPPMSRSVAGVVSTESLGQYLDSFYGKSANWPLRVGSAFPGFHDIYSQAGVGDSYGFLDARDGATLQETLDRAIEAEVPIIQLVTWNDFGEGTVIEPTEENGYRYLEIIQETVRGLRLLPFQPADLEIPRMIYEWRRQTFAGTPLDQKLDLAADLLIAGESQAARAAITALTPTQIEPAPATESISVGPNPSDGMVTMSIDLPTSDVWTVVVYDLLGRTMAELASGRVSAGPQHILWDAQHAPAGMYFIQVLVGRTVITEPVLIR